MCHNQTMLPKWAIYSMPPLCGMPCQMPMNKCVNDVFSDMRVFLTIAVDLVIDGIQEPVRFLIETKAKIFPTTERFWYFSKKPHHEQFVLKLKEVRFHYSCFY